MEDVAGGTARSSKIKEKVRNVSQLCRENGIILNPTIFKVSKTNEVRGFEIG